MVQLEKWTSYHQYGQKKKLQSSNSNHSGNSEFNSVLLLNQIVLESWVIKVHGVEDVSKGKDNKKRVDLMY